MIALFLLLFLRSFVTCKHWICPSTEQQHMCLLDSAPSRQFSQLKEWNLFWNTTTNEQIQDLRSHAVISNGFHGYHSAQLLFTFLQDAMNLNASSKLALNLSERIYVVEFGAQSGAFSHSFLHFLTKLEQYSLYPLENLLYILVDITPTRQYVEKWKQNLSLKKWITRGLVDFSSLDPFHLPNPLELHLLVQQITLRPGRLKNPLIFLTTSVLSSLPQDIYKIENNRVYELLWPENMSVATSSQAISEGHFHAINLSALQLSLSRDSYYLIRWYQKYFRHSTQPAILSLPSRAIHLIQNFTSLANSRIVWIVTEQALTNPQDFIQPNVSAFLMRNTSKLTLTLNLHAIAVLWGRFGGVALLNFQKPTLVKMGVLIVAQTTNMTKFPFGKFSDMVYRLQKRASTKFPQLVNAFESLDSFDLLDYYQMQMNLYQVPKHSLQGLISFLKLSRWDSTQFYLWSDELQKTLATENYGLQLDLIRGLPKVWAHFFFSDPETSSNVALEIARVYYQLELYDEAMKYLKYSLNLFGPSKIVYLQMALIYICHAQVANSTPEQKLAYLQQAHENLLLSVQVDPNFVVAKTYQRKIQQMMTEIRNT